MLGNPALERKWLEMTYDGVMTVTGSQKKNVDGETVVTPDAVLYEGQPCALSFSGTPDGAQGEDASEIAYQGTIFCAPELTIPAGCRITVTQYGVTYALRYSGEGIVYPTHQQLSVTRKGRA